MNHTATAKLKLRIGGTLIPGEHVYIERPSDRQLIELLKQGEYCNVLTSRQMGKSSLMMQTAAKLSAEGYHVATPEASLLADLIQAAFSSLDESLRDPHFSYIQGFLAQRTEDPLVTLKLYREILRGEDVKDQVAPAHIELKLAGIVKRGPKGLLIVRNEIYRCLFTDEWAARTAESATEQIRETTALLTAAEIYEEHLRQTDDYRTAMSDYLSLRNNPAYEKCKASEFWAEFFDRRAAWQR